MHFQNNQRGTLRCTCHLQHQEKSPMKSSRLSWNCASHYSHELGKHIKSTKCMAWWSSRSSNGFFDLTRVQTNASSKIKIFGLWETNASGNRQASIHNDWWKANWWNKFQQEGSRRTWKDEVWDVLRILYIYLPNPDDELKILVKMVLEWWTFITFFCRQSFSDIFL